MTEPRCDCWRHKHQVCDVCQGADGKDLPSPGALDTLRLDWLDASHFHLQGDVWFTAPDGRADAGFICHGLRFIGDPPDPIYPTARAAIDAAKENERAYRIARRNDPVRIAEQRRLDDLAAALAAPKLSLSARASRLLMGRLKRSRP